MDYVDYSPPSTINPALFPSVAASPSNPKTLLAAHNGVIYTNVGSGWVAACQPATASVYAGFTTLPASTQTAVISNLATSTVSQGVVSGMPINARSSDLLTRRK